jgi:hypothetical protein
MDNRGLPPEMSNFYCLPGRAGGTPRVLEVRLRLSVSSFFRLSLSEYPYSRAHSTPDVHQEDRAETTNDNVEYVRRCAPAVPRVSHPN